MSKILDKIKEPKQHLESSDLTSDEKIRLYSMLDGYGLGKSKAYARLFRDGFDRWELVGINTLCSQFVADHKDELATAYTAKFGTETDAGKWMTEYTARSNANLITLVSEVRGLRTRLFEYLSESGLSRSACYSRFAKDDWQPWERLGMFDILKEFAHDTEKIGTT